jgi:hypothetical protein
MPLPDVPDTYRITLRQSFSGQEILNVFYYRDVAISGFNPVAVAQGFWDHIKATYRPLLAPSANVIAQQVDCEFLSGAHPFGSYPIPVGEQQGTRAGSLTYVTPTLAALITLKVSTRVTRPGSKRIMGVCEEDLNGFTLAAGYVTILQNFANVLDQVVDPTGLPAGTVTPVIVGYPTLLQPGAPRVQDVSDAVASPYVSHQVSRDERP